LQACTTMPGFLEFFHLENTQYLIITPILEIIS
jgi:hypothetical protein